ncbi:antitoxin AF2212-like protein [Geoglobus acetivorans]
MPEVIKAVYEGGVFNSLEKGRSKEKERR